MLSKVPQPLPGGRQTAKEQREKGADLVSWICVLDRQGMSLLLRDVKRKNRKCIFGIIILKIE